MRKGSLVFLGGLVCLFTISPESRNQNLSSGTADAVQTPNPSTVKLEANYGKMPLYFIANKGQLDDRVAYYVQGKDKSIYFCPGEVTFVLNTNSDKIQSIKSGLIDENPLRKILDKADKVTERWAVKLEFVGGDRSVKPQGQEETGAIISYFKGKAEDWKTGIPTYSKIVYENLWPGIDLVY